MDAENTSELNQASSNSIGPLLKAAREKRGIAIEQMADKLKLKISTLQALEKNDYRGLGGIVYVKGYLRSYAKLLDINIEQQLHELDEVAAQFLAQSEKEKPAPYSEARSEQTGLWTSLIVLAIAAVIAFAWHYYHKKQEESQPAEVTAPAATVVASDVKSQSIEMPKPVIETKPVAPVVTNTSAVKSVNATTNPTSVANPAVVATTAAPVAVTATNEPAKNDITAFSDVVNKMPKIDGAKMATNAAPADATSATKSSNTNTAATATSSNNDSDDSSSANNDE